MTVEQAAKAYLAVATKANKALRAAQKRYKNATGLAANRRFYAALAKSEAAFIAGVKAIPFPAAIQPDATALIRASVVYRRDVLGASKSHSLLALYDNAMSALKANRQATDKAAILRDDLGLPPNV